MLHIDDSGLISAARSACVWNAVNKKRDVPIEILLEAEWKRMAHLSRLEITPQIINVYGPGDHRVPGAAKWKERCRPLSGGISRSLNLFWPRRPLWPLKQIMRLCIPAWAGEPVKWKRSPVNGSIGLLFEHRQQSRLCRVSRGSFTVPLAFKSNET